mgnify:CR=1 FL=1
MESLKESVAYLHGLVEGVDLDVTTKEGRIITGIVETMGDIARSMEKLEARQADLEIYLDSIDEDLIDLEENVYQLDEGDFVEVECPECHDIVFFDADILEDEDTVEVTCPNCEAVVFVNDGEYNADYEETGCQCGSESIDKDILQ